MSNYSEDEEMVRVDFFKPSGKWYATHAVKWTGGYNATELIYDAFKKSLRDHLAKEPDRFSGMTAVCLHPYHELEHPLMLVNGSWGA